MDYFAKKNKIILKISEWFLNKEIKMANNCSVKFLLPLFVILWFYSYFVLKNKLGDPNSIYLLIIIYYFKMLCLLYS